MKTPAALQPLIDDRVIDEVIRSLKSGERQRSDGLSLNRLVDAGQARLHAFGILTSCDRVRPLLKAQ
jgi:hypothetical protein